MIFTGKTYDNLKHLTQVVLPAGGALYAGLAVFWGFPNGEEVVGSVALVTTFLGVLLGVSSRNYEASGAAYDGDMLVGTNAEGGLVYSLDLEGDPVELAEKTSIRFRVVAPDTE